MRRRSRKSVESQLRRIILAKHDESICKLERRPFWQYFSDEETLLEILSAEENPFGNIVSRGDPCGNIVSRGDPCGNIVSRGDPCGNIVNPGDRVKILSDEGLNYYPQRDSRLRSNQNSSPNLRNSTDPLYSQWSEWTPCSATCGRGIISRTRTCLKSMYNSRGVSIPLCHGEFSEHKICNLKECPGNSSDMRATQCTQYNNQVIAGKLVKTWIPANGGPNPCELRCEAIPEKLVYGFGKVVDGTPCTLGVCLDGRCLRVGCDDRLGSGVTVDMCGVCGGRNSNCVHYKDVYQGQPSSGSASRSSYHEVVVIPASARNLIIRQPLVKNILALQDRSKGIIFNRDQTAMKYGSHYEIAGSTVEFLKIDDIAEELVVKGPLNQELYVLVLLRSHNPGIYYEYWLPKQSYTHGRSHYPLKSPNNPVLPTLATPTASQSYSVPVFEVKPKTTPTPCIVDPSHPHPPFAYGYGEKPYKGHEYPIFRHIPSTSPPPAEKKEYFKSSEGDSFGGETKNSSVRPFQERVIRAQVVGYEFLQGETRYELEVKQSFKNTFSLLPREYIWSPDTCRCPRLRTGKEYIIMGKSDHTYKKRESRLLVDKTCFVRTFNLKYARRLQKLRKDQDKKCKKVS
ncbi:ADAMTS-like protein 5 like protein [Argiope bruennichi]|uniref:ADAMTS-like protein 5 like protein n=1 Tax=Argiope bruennichi TaxID=94029 RepID=A0A8T0FXZ2_ARGBR|nr:ADAMTS-like protein 5 like protein [Argiope bruennichi]